MGGFPKGKLHLNGHRLFDRVFNVLQATVPEVAVSVHEEPPLQIPDSAQRIQDRFTNHRSSMNGVFSVLAEVKAPTIIIPWDMPFVTVDQLEQLKRENKKNNSSSGIFYELEDMIQPFPGLYRPSLKQHLKSSIEDNQYSLRKVLDRSDVKIIDATETPPTPLKKKNFSSVNSPEDFRRFSTE